MSSIEESLAQRLDEDLKYKETVVEMMKRVKDELLLRHPIIVSRLEWIRARQRGEEKMTDFLCRESAMRRWCDLEAMSTMDWICLVQIAGCAQSDLVGEFLKQEIGITEASIKDITTKYELLKCTKKGLKFNEEPKPYKARKVKEGKDKGGKGGSGGAGAGAGAGEGSVCYRCQGTDGHWTNKCTVLKEKLYCSHCGKKGVHNTNDFCKDKQAKWKKENSEKAQKIETGEAKPEAEPEKGKQIKHSEEEDLSPDEDECERFYINQCLSSEEEKRTYFGKAGYKYTTEKSGWRGGRRRSRWSGPRGFRPLSGIQRCRAQQVSGGRSGKSQMQGTPPVILKLTKDKEDTEVKKRRGSHSRKLISCCPDTGASTNVVNEREARRMDLPVKKSDVKLENASGQAMKYRGKP